MNCICDIYDVCTYYYLLAQARRFNFLSPEKIVRSYCWNKSFETDPPSHPFDTEGITECFRSYRALLGDKSSPFQFPQFRYSPLMCKLLLLSRVTRNTTNEAFIFYLGPWIMRGSSARLSTRSTSTRVRAPKSIPEKPPWLLGVRLTWDGVHYSRLNVFEGLENFEWMDERIKLRGSAEMASSSALAIVTPRSDLKDMNTFLNTMVRTVSVSLF